MSQSPEKAAKTAENENGHVAVQVEGLHAPELTFSFEHRQSRVGVGAAFGTHVFFALVVLFLMYYAPSPNAGGPQAPMEYPKEIVWIPQAGPGGGGGGGGNQMPDPPKKAELPGKEKITVPVTKPPAPQPQKPKEEPPDPAMNIPAKTMADATQMSPGMLDAAMAASMISTGSGSAGGGKRVRSILPFEVTGHSCSTTIASGTMCSGSARRNAARMSSANSGSRRSRSTST